MREPRTSSLSKALTILDAFTERDVAVSMTELAKRTGLPRSTAHRLIGELVRWGALERTAAGLSIGLRLFELGHLGAPRSLGDVALPYLEGLQAATRKTVNLGVRDRGDIVYLVKLSSSGARVPESRQGGRLPLHCTALGKAILASSPDEVVDEVLSGSLAKVTSATRTEPDVIRMELTTIRRRRVAFEFGESAPGVICVASGVTTARQGVVAAVSVTGLSSPADARRVAPAVLTTALSLSHALSDVPAQPARRGS
jgi:DNA-binding IclR family transcriptional regulator